MIFPLLLGFAAPLKASTQAPFCFFHHKECSVPPFWFSNPAVCLPFVAHHELLAVLAFIYTTSDYIILLYCEDLLPPPSIFCPTIYLSRAGRFTMLLLGLATVHRLHVTAVVCCESRPECTCVLCVVPDLRVTLGDSMC